MKTRVLLTAVIVLLALTGCFRLPTYNPDTAPSLAEQPDPPAVQENAAFGTAVTYVDEVSISVSEPAEFTPTEYAAGNDQAYQVVFSITITNGSDANLDPATYSRVSSGGVEASQIFDFDNSVGDLSYGPSTVILPGGTITWLEAYSITDLQSIIFQIAPSYDYDDAIFTNAG